MDLHVTFTGLCLFVPHRGEGRMHVLMPRTGHHGNIGHVGSHTVTLDYTGGHSKLDMNGWRLDISGLGGTGTTLDLPDGVLDIGAITGKKVDKQQWEDFPRSTVVARVTLPPAGEVQLGKRVKWRVGWAQQRLTHRLTWIIPNVDLDTIRWQRHRLHAPTGSKPQDLPRPQPDDEGLVRLFVRHVPEQDPIVCENDEADHIQAYYPVYKELPTDRPNPVLAEKSPDPRCPEGLAKTLPDTMPKMNSEDDEDPLTVGGSPFNCMLAQSEPG